MSNIEKYPEENIKILEWREHIRMRPNMYIGQLGNGTRSNDGIYELLKIVVQNSVDEHMMGYGNKIIVDVTDEMVIVRDYGRGIPFGRLVDVVSKMNTGCMGESRAFKNLIGLNGVGIRGINALSISFEIKSVRNGQMKSARFECGKLIEESAITACDEPDGTLVQFIPDASIFCGYRYRDEFIKPLLKNYTDFSTDLIITFNGENF